MLNGISKNANALFYKGDYSGALNAYCELGSILGFKLVYANILLCLQYQWEQSGHGSYFNNELSNKVLEGGQLEDVIVSLTSYPARINIVHKTIKSLLAQSVKPSKTILWLAEEQFPNKKKDLPDELLQLEKEGLDIEWCSDVKSYKKLIPALSKYPDKAIVTADDDTLYEKDWLIQLYLHHLRNPKDIVCHRAHRLVFDEHGKVKPYREWHQGTVSGDSSFINFFTGCGGVLYPPKTLHKSVLNQEEFTRICPSGDDIWFWGMSVLNGTKISVVPYSIFKLDQIPDSQSVALWIQNVRGGDNNNMLQSLFEAYPEIVNKLSSEIVSTINTEIKVSVIIPVFNTGDELAVCLDSLIRQSFKKIEVLCIDDGSSSELTQRILNRYASQCSMIRILRQNNSGPATARNNGIKNAQGDYIAFVDSDDYISENYIEKLYETAIRDNSDIVAADKIVCFNNDGTQLDNKKSGLELYGKVNAKRLATDVIATTGVSWNKMYKKSFLQKNRIEYMDGMRCQAEDNYFSIFAVILGYKNISIAEGVTYFYRQHSSSITKNITKNSLEDSMALYESIQTKLQGIQIADKTYWRNVINARAIRDLRYSARGVPDIGNFEEKYNQKFTSHIDVCCIADDKYTVPTLVFLESVRKTKRKTTSLSITILVPQGSKQKMMVLEKLSGKDFLVNIVEVDAAQFQNLHKYKEKDNYTMASPSALFKFIIPDIFKELDRILYIDTDLIVRKDLLELFMVAMENEYLCAVVDLWTPVTDREDIKKFKSYFNSGVMLMNLAKMRNDDIPRKLIAAKINSTNFNLMDQDVFNEVCNGRVRTMDITYNFLPVCYKRHQHRFKLDAINKLYNSNYRSIQEIAADPVVAHWAGSEKPWVTKETLFANEWEKLFQSLSARGLMKGLAIPTPAKH